jgi:hypothetical protein
MNVIYFARPVKGEVDWRFRDNRLMITDESAPKISRWWKKRRGNGLRPTVNILFR